IGDTARSRASPACPRVVVVHWPAALVTAPVLLGVAQAPPIEGFADEPVSMYLTLSDFSPRSSGSVTSAAAYWSRSTSGLVDEAVDSASSLGVASGSPFCVEQPASTMNPAAASAATRKTFRFTTITPLRYDQSLLANS